MLSTIGALRRLSEKAAGCGVLSIIHCNRYDVKSPDQDGQLQASIGMVHSTEKSMFFFL